jgi:hypothetical protein
MLSPIHPEGTKLKATTLHMRGSVYYCMGRHTFQALSLWHQFHFVYQPPTYRVVDDQRQVYW